MDQDETVVRYDKGVTIHAKLFSHGKEKKNRELHYRAICIHHVVDWRNVDFVRALYDEY